MADIKKIATRDAYGATLLELGRENKNIVVLDADLSKSTKTCEFAAEFPERFFNMGIAECGMVVTAAGMATCGKIPFLSTFAVFASGRAWEPVRMSLGYTHQNVKIGATHAGITVGEDGASHQANEDIALMRAIPGMVVLVPADGIETAKAVRAAAEYNGPVYIRLGRSGVPVIFDDNFDYKIGKANVMIKGTDVTIIACGIMTCEAMKAAESLQTGGISAEVINMGTVKPLDVDAIIKSAKKTGAVVTAEEHTIIGGLGSAVAEALGEAYPVPVKKVGMKDTFGESGKPNDLLKKYGLTTDDIVAAAKASIAMKGKK